MISNIEMHAVEADYQILHAKLFSACTPRASWKVLHANHANQKSRAGENSSPILKSFSKGAKIKQKRAKFHLRISSEPQNQIKIWLDFQRVERLYFLNIFF